MLKRILFVWLGVLVWAAPIRAGELTTNSPADPGAAARVVVESLHSVLLRCMKEADQLGFRGRYDRISESLGETFDLAFMARISISPVWKQLGEEQRRDFVALQRRLSASKYADNFDGFGGQHFATLSHEPAARGTILVKTEFVQPEDDNVLFDYRLRKTVDGWRIIDVQLDGKISEVTLRRSEYRAFIKRKGFPELIEAIQGKIQELEMN